MKHKCGGTPLSTARSSFALVAIVLGSATLTRSRLLSGGGEALIRILTRSSLGTFAAPSACALGASSLVTVY